MNLDRESVRVRLQKRPDPLSLLGNSMAAKTPPKPKHKKSKAGPAPTHAASMVSTATQSLINMVSVGAVSGAVLLTLLAARHF